MRIKPSPFSLASYHLFLTLHSISNVNLNQKYEENLKPCMPIRHGNIMILDIVILDIVILDIMLDIM